MILGASLKDILSCLGLTCGNHEGPPIGHLAVTECLPISRPKWSTGGPISGFVASVPSQLVCSFYQA